MARHFIVAYDRAEHLDQPSHRCLLPRFESLDARRATSNERKQQEQGCKLGELHGSRAYVQFTTPNKRKLKLPCRDLRAGTSNQRTRVGSAALPGIVSLSALSSHPFWAEGSSMAKCLFRLVLSRC